MKYCGPDVTSFKRKVKMVGDNDYNAMYPEERKSGESKSSEESSMTSKKDTLGKVPEINKNLITEEPLIHRREKMQALEPRREELVEESLSSEPAETGIQKELSRQRKKIPWYQKVIQELKEKTRKTGSKLTSYFLSKTNFRMKKIEMSLPQNWTKTKWDTQIELNLRVKN